MNYKELPILFIIFNRIETSIESFKQIRLFQPQKLYIASDGPRDEKKGEDLLVTQTREQILSLIDWECEVNTLFQDYNLGCGKGVFTAIEWFFSNVEYGIILEDDCIAQQSFFQYAYEMLIRYRTDERIGMIAGTNPINNPNQQYSIIFSKYKSCWGWGTWKRAWKNMDLNMSWRKAPEANDIISNCGYKGRDVSIWRYKINCIDNDYVSAWDWQWYFSLAAQNQLCIYPKYNQVSNIGNDDNATHTSFSNIMLQSCPLDFPLIIPDYIVPNELFDKKFYSLSNNLFARISRKIPHSLKKYIKQKISRCRK